MPPALVDSASQKVDGLSEGKAEDIWEEVKKSLRDDGEIPDNEDDMSEQDWGLLVDAFLTTISARFDVDKSELTESRVKSFLEKKLTVQQFIEGLLDREQFKWNVKDFPLERAKEVAREKLNEEGMTLEGQLPNFDRNYRDLSKRVQDAPDIPRIEMPVIEPEDIDVFEKELNEGTIDVFRPFSFDSPFFPTEFPEKGVTKSEFIGLGQQDGEKTDDVIPAEVRNISVENLRPTQGEIWYEKLIGNIKQFGAPEQDSIIFDRTIISSKDGFILDGHHRWAQAFLTDRSLEMKSLDVPIELERLLDIGRSLTSVFGNEPKQ